jgi:Zn-dependent M28 family amino/carboxypeptidase
MRFILTAAVSALALSACATYEAAPAAETASQAAAAPITDRAIEAHIRFLADDLMEGRDTGERGFDIAARYVESHFRQYGLEPGAADGGYHEPVPLYNIAADPGRAAMSVDGEALTAGEDFLVAPSAAHDDSAIEAEAVFVGFGLDLPAHGLDSYAGVDLDGKIAVMLAGAPEGLASDVAAHLGSTRTKAGFAAERGARGVIVIAAEGLTRWDFGRMAQAAAGARPSMTTPVASGPDSIAVSATIPGATAERLFRASGRSYADMLAAATSGGQIESFETGATVRLAQGTTREPVASANVIGVLPGSDPDLAHETVVVTAHLDHIGICQPMAEDPICNGALDNASGTAAMLEGARALSEGPRPRRSIVFIALTAEEKGLLGSAHVAANPTPAMGEMVANINLDMPVMLYEFNDLIGFGAEHSNLGPIAAAAAEAAGSALSPDPIPDQSLFVRSDHYNFVREGVPALFLMTGFSSPDPEADEGAAFLRFLGTDYHQPGDDLSQPLRFDQGARFATINMEIIRAVADSDARPAWNADSFFNAD